MRNITGEVRRKGEVIKRLGERDSFSFETQQLLSNDVWFGEQHKEKRKIKKRICKAYGLATFKRNSEVSLANCLYKPSRLSTYKQLVDIPSRKNKNTTRVRLKVNVGG